MSQAPSYLLLSRHSVWYFRIAVPGAIRALFGCREVRRSLQTRCKREALIRSREMLGQVQSAFTEAFLGRKPNLQGIGLSGPAARRGEGWQGWLCTPATSKASSEPLMPRSAAPTLSEVMEEYAAQQAIEGVSPKTVAAKRAVVRLLKRVIGDLPLDLIRRREAQAFRQTALTLPPWASQRPDQSLVNLARDATTTINVSTFNHYVKNLKTVFAYAIQEGYCERNPFEGLTIRQRGKASAQRARFTEDDLIRLFDPEVYGPETKGRPYRYWLPLLAIYTGARLNELCQLYVDDIEKVDGIECLHIQALRPDQKIKNATSERLIPIHPELKERGFLDYIADLKVRGEERAFPELSLHKHHGYGHTPSRWFSSFRKRLEFTDAEAKKDFHSFRHTVADHLKQAGQGEDKIAALLGHEFGGITHNRYGKSLRPRGILILVEQLNFKLSA